MDFTIETPDPGVAGQVEQLLRFYLTGFEEEGRVEIRVESVLDPLGTRLYRCSLCARPRNADAVMLTECQSDLVLAVGRLLDRSVRTLRRRTLAGRPRLHA